MVWRGKRPKPKETRRRDGRGLPGGLDRTGQDRPGPNQGEGDENEQSGGNRDRQRPRSDRSDTHSTAEQRSRRRASSAHLGQPATHWHTATMKKNDNRRVGDCAVCSVQCAVLCCVCLAGPRWWWCVLYSPCKRRAYPCRRRNVIGSCPRFVGRLPACSAGILSDSGLRFAVWRGVVLAVQAGSSSSIWGSCELGKTGALLLLLLPSQN